MRAKWIFGILMMLLISCKTTQTNLIITDNYDSEKNLTTLSILPYGDIVIPNQWVKTDYNRVNLRHFFENNDSTTIAVSKNPKNKHPIFKSNQTDKQLVSELVRWDSEYWEEQGCDITIIDDQSEKGYILWQAKSENRNVDVIFLFGIKNNFAYNFSGSSKTWSEPTIREFLVQLFESN